MLFIVIFRCADQPLFAFCRGDIYMIWTAMSRAAKLREKYFNLFLRYFETIVEALATLFSRT